MDQTRGRPIMPAKSVPKKANPDMVREIRRRRAEGARLKTLSADYGLSEPLISRICNRLAWKHVQ